MLITILVLQVVMIVVLGAIGFAARGSVRRSEASLLQTLTLARMDIAELREAVARTEAQRLDLEGLIRERIAARVSEWKSGGGRAQLRDRLQQRGRPDGARSADGPA